MKLARVHLIASMVGVIGYWSAVAAPVDRRVHVREGLSWQVSEAPLAREPSFNDRPVNAERLDQVEVAAVSRYDGLLSLSQDERRYLQELRQAREEELLRAPRLQADLGETLLFGSASWAPAPAETGLLFGAGRDGAAATASKRGGAFQSPGSPSSPVYVKYPAKSATVGAAPRSTLPLGQALGLRSISSDLRVTPSIEEAEPVYVLSAAGAGENVTSPLRLQESADGLSFASFNPIPTANDSYVDEFGSLTGWFSRDGEMTVSHNPTGGTPGGAMEGNFASQMFPIPETDAFRLASGSGGITPAQEAAFMGDYTTINAYPSRLSWAFDIKAEDVLPSDLVFRFSDGASTFFLPFTGWLNSVGDWQRVYIPLEYSKGWLGGSYTDFWNALGNVTSIEIQITRSGTGSQSYLIDNFQVIDFSIPEPSTAGFLVLSSVAIAARRWMQRGQRRSRRERRE